MKDWLKEWWLNLQEGPIDVLGFVAILAATIALTWFTMLVLWPMLIWGMWAIIAFLGYMVWGMNREYKKLEALLYSRSSNEENDRRQRN